MEACIRAESKATQEILKRQNGKGTFYRKFNLIKHFLNSHYFQSLFRGSYIESGSRWKKRGFFVYTICVFPTDLFMGNYAP